MNNKEKQDKVGCYCKYKPTGRDIHIKKLLPNGNFLVSHSFMDCEPKFEANEEEIEFA